jgi:hypothetical protein
MNNDSKLRGPISFEFDQRLSGTSIFLLFYLDSVITFFSFYLTPLLLYPDKTLFHCQSDGAIPLHCVNA